MGQNLNGADGLRKKRRLLGDRDIPFVDMHKCRLIRVCSLVFVLRERITQKVFEL